MTDEWPQPDPPEPPERIEAPAPPPEPERVSTSTPPAREEKPGVRIGPFVWVGELGVSGASDPWAHRKGEPRTFTLLWAIYLMAGALMTIFAVRSASGAGIRQWTYGCRAMVIVVVVGVCILWPMVRLSQASPERPRKSTLIDLMILLVPIQAVVWPMPLLSGWTWIVTVGIVLMLFGWGLLIGGLVARGCASSTSFVRTWTMASILGLVCAGPVLSFFVDWMAMPAGTRLPEWWGLTSPLTATHALTTTPMNLMPTMDPLEWAAGWLPLVAGLLYWAWLSRRPDAARG